MRERAVPQIMQKSREAHQKVKILNCGASIGINRRGTSGSCSNLVKTGLNESLEAPTSYVHNTDGVRETSMRRRREDVVQHIRLLDVFEPL